MKNSLFSILLFLVLLIGNKNGRAQPQVQSTPSESGIPGEIHQVESPSNSVTPNPVTSGEVRYLTYEEAVAIAFTDNVDLLAIREQEQSFKQRSAQALAPNEPVLSYNKNDVPGFSLTQKEAQAIYQLSWTLGFPGKALANSAVIRHQAEGAREQGSAQEIAIMTSLSNLYVSLATNEAFYKFYLDEQLRDRALRKLLEKKFAASQAAKVDLLNAEVVTQNIALNILENRNDYETYLTQFRQILRKPSDKLYFPKVPDKVSIPDILQTFDELVPLMLRNNHSISIAQKQVESSRATLTNASLQALPDFQLSAALNEWVPSAAPNGSSVLRDYSFGIGLQIPLFFALNELPGIHAARHDLGAAEHQYSSAQLQAISALQTAYTSLKASLKAVDVSQRLVVPAAKASYDLTLLTYGLGKANYFMLVQARQAWHDAERDLLTKRQSAGQFYNQLIAQMGCDPKKSEGAYVCK